MVLQFKEVGWPPHVYTSKLKDKWFDKAIKSLQVDVYQLSHVCINEFRPKTKDHFS